MNILSPLITGAVGAAIASGIFGIIMYKMKRKDEKEDRRDDLVLALQMLMYERIKHTGYSYINRGYVTAEELEDLMRMHKVYHNNLNGNGFLDNLMESVKHLPLR